MRDMSANQFAKMVGVSHAVILKFMNHGITDTYAGNPVGDPDIKFLYKLAKATHIDLCAIVSLLYPDATLVDAEATIFASRYTALSEEQRHIMKAFIRGMGLDKDDELTE